MRRIAALLTVHNRKERTLSTLKSLFAQIMTDVTELTTYLVDDGCTDGTAQAVRKSYPQIKILKGTGGLFWNGGMRMAFSEASKESYDTFLWLNDDIDLYPGALNRLLLVDVACQHNAIIVGSLRDPVTGVQTYGGVRCAKPWRPLKFELVQPGDGVISVDAMNGNIVIVPVLIARALGNLDAEFTHGLGDFDYGLRARKIGFSVVVAPGFAGTCKRNNSLRTWKDPALPFLTRWKKLLSPHGLPPREWAIFARRYTGMWWFFFWLSPYAHFFIDNIFHLTALRKLIDSGFNS